MTSKGLGADDLDLDELDLDDLDLDELDLVADLDSDPNEWKSSWYTSSSFGFWLSEDALSCCAPRLDFRGYIVPAKTRA